MKKSESGIYSITNKVNGKSYIGMSGNIRIRFSRHKSTLRENKHFNQRLQSAFNKYGEKAFVFEVLEYCPIDMLSEREMYYIDLYNSMIDGYNLKTGGHENLIFSEETKRKISESNKGKKVSKEAREKIRKTLTGFKHSEETRKKLSEMRKGENNVNYGGLSSEHIKNMADALRGRKQSKEHVKNMMEARFGYYYNLECIKLHYEYGLGACLIKPLHEEFHKIYGFKNFTVENFHEFVLRYREGEQYDRM